jgi:hypothetical protein
LARLTEGLVCISSKKNLDTCHNGAQGKQSFVTGQNHFDSVAATPASPFGFPSENGDYTIPIHMVAKMIQPRPSPQEVRER